MRPTLLQFRSTKEKTPLSYDFKSTYDGRSVAFSSPKGDSRRSSFNCEKRFVAYDILAKRTGYRVGPGSYSPDLYRPRIRSGSPYRQYHLEKETSNNGYYMVGDSLLFEPNMILNASKKYQADNLIMKDTTYLSCKSAKTASTSMSATKKSSFDDWPQIRRFSVTKQKKKKTKKRKLILEDVLRKRFIN